MSEILIWRYPNLFGVSLPIGFNELQDKSPVANFIEMVYVHPTLTSDSMMVHTVKEINKRFGVKEIPVVADKIEAFGTNIMLKPTIKKIQIYHNRAFIN
jgi:hypothetical protein